MKKTIKPTAIMLITAVIAVLALAGCNNEPDNNKPAATETAAKPAAAPEGGEVADNTPITLTSETAGAEIYYTQDGTEPGTASALYSDTNKPRITTGKLTLKAIAVKDGMNKSAMLTAVYTILTVELIADAGEDQTVTLAHDLTVTLDGSGSSGTITAYAWECTEYTKHEGVTAPYTTGEINNLITPATDLSKAAVALRKAGTYVFELTVKDTAGVEKTAEVTVVVEAFTVTKDVNVVAVKFSDGPVLQFNSNTTDNYSIVGGADAYFKESDLYNITYILSSTNPVKDLSDCNNGNIPASKYGSTDYPTITQTFYYNGQMVGSRKVVVELDPGGFSYLYEYKPADDYDTDFVPIPAIPTTTLTNLKKEIAELP